MWSLINDDEWDCVCHQSKDAISEDILRRVGDFSILPYNGEPQGYGNYKALCTIINRLFNLCDDKYIMQITAYDREQDDHVGMKPSLCMYEKTSSALIACTLPSISEAQQDEVTIAGNEFTDTATQHSGETLAFTEGHTARSPHQGQEIIHASVETSPEVLRARDELQARTAWAWMTMFVEVKHKQSYAPYKVHDGGKLELSKNEDAEATRVQISKYVAEILLRQHRKFVFCAVFINRMAYLMRWDRTGVLVATPFDYIDEPRKLFAFFYRIAMADRSLQGYDSTVTLASEQEVKTFNEYRDSLPQDSIFLRNCLDRSLVNQNLYPIHKVTCPDPSGQQREYPDPGTYDQEAADASPDPVNTALHSTGRSRTYLIGKYHHGTRSPTGRGGKGYVAYDVEHHRSVFLKDYWYADHPMVHPETEVYQKLARAKVRNVATLLAGGDVVDLSGCQETLTQEYLTSEPRPAKRRHHRLVVEEIGQPLESYRNGRELIQALYDALLAHRDAWEKAEILHTDVSMDNILINIVTGKAFLNDWDLCKYAFELHEDASKQARTGTWPYMSALLLDCPRKPNELADDVESFLHVYTISILRFHPHSLERVPETDGLDEDLALHLHWTYFGTRRINGYYVSTGRKRRLMTRGDWDFDFEGDTNPMLSTLLIRLYQLAKEHYDTVDYKQLVEDWGANSAGEKVARRRRELSANQRSFDNHRYLEEILAGVLDEFKYAPDEVKIQDQFEGLGSYIYVPPGAGRSCSKRPSDSGASGS